MKKTFMVKMVAHPFLEIYNLLCVASLFELVNCHKILQIVLVVRSCLPFGLCAQRIFSDY